MVFGLGDYLDWTRTTHRVSLKAAWQDDDKAMQEFDELVMDGLVYPFVDRVRKACPSFATKCLGLVEGNHHGSWLSTYANRERGRTTTEEICHLLGVPYLGLSAWVRICVAASLKQQGMGKAHNLNLVLNHSTSSSGKLAASLSAAQRRLEGWRNVDVFLSANDHQLGHVLRQEIGCTQRGMPRPAEYQQVIGKVGSFQKGYSEDAESNNYVEKRFLHPSQLGWLAFDAHIYVRQNTIAEKARSRHNSPEVWRFSNFNV